MTFLPSAPSRPAVRPLVALFIGLSAAIAHAQGDPPPPDPIAHRHDRCVEPAFRADDLDVSSEPGGYGIEVQGERHWIALDRRTTFALRLADGGDAVAQVKIDRPPAGAFEDQARWRLRWLEDVAARAGVAPLRQTLPGNAWLLTLNKPVLTGRAAGLSVLADPRRQAFVQWDWTILPRYAGAQDVATMQGNVWQRLLPCLLAS